MNDFYLFIADTIQPFSFDWFDALVKIFLLGIGIGSGLIYKKFFKNKNKDDSVESTEKSLANTNIQASDMWKDLMEASHKFQERVSQTNDDLERDKKELELKLDDARNKIIELEKDISKLRIDNDELKTLLSETRKQLDQLKAFLSTLQIKVTSGSNFNVPM